MEVRYPPEPFFEIVLTCEGIRNVECTPVVLQLDACPAAVLVLYCTQALDFIASGMVSVESRMQLDDVPFEDQSTAPRLQKEYCPGARRMIPTTRANSRPIGLMASLKKKPEPTRNTAASRTRLIIRPFVSTYSRRVALIRSSVGILYLHVFVP